MALNPDPSNLDSTQIIQRSFNPATDRIRTDAEFSGTISGEIECIIDASTGDNIAIANADGTLKVDVETINGKNALDVNILGGTIEATNPSVGVNTNLAPTSSTQIGGVDINGDLQSALIGSNGRLLVDSGQIFGIQDLKILFNEVSSIAIGSETVINTYTAPLGKISYLLSILNSGENRAQYNIYNTASLFDRQYSNVTNLTTIFDYKTGSSSVPGMVISPGNIITVAVVNAGTSISNYNSRFMILEVV